MEAIGSLSQVCSECRRELSLRTCVMKGSTPFCKACYNELHR